MRRLRAVGLLLGFLFAARVVTADPLPAAPPDIRLTQTTGQVLITIATGKAKGPPPSVLPFALAEGDLVKTASSSTAEIAFAEGTLIRIGPESALRLKALSPKRIVLVLKSGVLLAKVHFEKSEGSTFQVLTPSALVTVRGTEFVVEESGARARIGVLDEGHVAVTAPGFKKEVVMHFNQETSVTRGLSPRNATVLERLYRHKIQMGQMRERLSDLRKHWETPSAGQLQSIRDAWILQNTPPPPPPPHHRHKHHHSQ